MRRWQAGVRCSRREGRHEGCRPGGREAYGGAILSWPRDPVRRRLAAPEKFLRESPLPLGGACPAGWRDRGPTPGTKAPAHIPTVRRGGDDRRMTQKNPRLVEMSGLDRRCQTVCRPRSPLADHIGAAAARCARPRAETPRLCGWLDRVTCRVPRPSRITRRALPASRRAGPSPDDGTIIPVARPRPNRPEADFRTSLVIGKACSARTTYTG